jgi:hypothetical protein
MKNGEMMQRCIRTGLVNFDSTCVSFLVVVVVVVARGGGGGGCCVVPDNGRTLSRMGGADSNRLVNDYSFLVDTWH